MNPTLGIRSASHQGLPGARRIVALVSATILSLALGLSWFATRSDAHGGATVQRTSFHDAMRGLWEEHVTWTRLFIVSFAGDVPDLEATTARLLQNQADIGNAIRPYYGDAAAEQLTALLHTHIVTAAQLLGAAKDGTAVGVTAASDAWYANANDIADFLAGANPRHWSSSDLRQMMQEHLDLTLAEAVAQLEHRYTDSIAAYDAVEMEIRQMADTLTEGIVAQFPAKFAR